MGRALLVLETAAERQKAKNWIDKAPVGTRVEFKASKRTLPQNDLLWALLTEVSQQLEHGGRRYEPGQWKAIFLHAFGREVSFLPSLDLKIFLPIELSSSDLSKDEMTNFIEFILKEGADRGVVFKEHKSDPADGSVPSSAVDDADSAPASEGDGEAASPSSPSSHADWLFNVARMLWAATNYRGDISVLKAQKLAAIGSYPKPEGCPNVITGKAEAVYGYCAQIVAGSIEPQDGLAVIAGVVGCDQDDLKPRQRGAA
ncbi:recombination protein NinB [Sinorhizobium glycinis]|uniref:recombination protein NinB n=1 Tax=Sinorhizobium glycinis TaxID=1472378 RepID=UPI0007D989F9|nr:recombination protein NinB [Sinorhizobium glycinis]